jgi:plastocyanin
MKLTRPLVLVVALAAALAGAALAGVVAHKSANVKTISVTEKEFHISLSTRKGTVGSDRFVIKNTGKLSHALAISGPGVKLKKTALIKPGRKATLTVTLKAGTYALWCPVPGHAAEGMKTSIKVPGTTTGGGTGGSGGGGTTSTPATTTDGEAWG